MQIGKTTGFFAAMLIALLPALSSCSGNDVDPATTVPASTTTAPASTTTAATEPEPIFTAGAPALWLADPTSAGIVRIDAVDPDDVTGAEVGFTPTAIAYAGGLIWVGGDATIAAVDPTTAAVVGTVSADGPVTRLIATPNGLWALSDGSVSAIDASTFTAGSPNTVNAPVDAVATATDLWVLGTNDLLQIDLATGERVTSYEIDLGDPAAVEAGLESILLFGGDGKVLRIDPANGSLISSEQLSVTAVAPAGVITADSGYWLLDESGQLVQLDADVNKGISVEVGVASAAVVGTGDAIWVVGSEGELIRVTRDEFNVLRFPLKFTPVAITAS